MLKKFRRMAAVFFTVFAAPAVVLALGTVKADGFDIGAFDAQVILRGFVAIVSFIIACLAIWSMYGSNQFTDSERNGVYLAFIASFACYLVVLMLPANKGIFDAEPVIYLLRVLFIWVFPSYVALDLVAEWLSGWLNKP